MALVVSRVSRAALLGSAVFCASLAVSPANANSLWVGMPQNYTGGSSDTIFVYGAPGITGTVSDAGFSSPFVIGALGVAQVTIPGSEVITTPNVVQSKGIQVTTTVASDRVGASYLSRIPFTTDATYLFDAASLGTDYYSLNYGTLGLGSQLTLIGTVDGTTLTVTPTVAVNGHPAGVPFLVTLNKGESVLYTGTSDISGTHVTSTSPIAVFAGDGCTDVPIGSFACDHLITSLPSTDNYSKNFIVPETAHQDPAGNIVRVLAATDGTTVKYNGATIATLNAGEFTEIAGVFGGTITADQPVLTTEYLTGQSTHPATTGDPAETYVPGIDQWLKDYIFSTAVGSEAYPTNVLTLAIQTLDLASLALTLNGAPVVLNTGADCAALGATIYSTCNIFITPGTGEISAANPFLGLLSAYGSFDTYLTFLGATFSPGASPPPPPLGTPEPATLALFGAGLAGLGALRRRRKAKS